MKIIKEFPISITIEDPIQVAENTDKYVEDYIRRFYEGKCFLGCMIDKLVKVVKKSNMILLENNLQGYANINIIFRAECSIYAVDEPLMFKVKVIKPDIILGGDLTKSIFIKRPNDPTKQLNDIVKLDQYLPVTVMQTVYNAFNKKPTIQTKLYMPPKESEYYEVDLSSVTGLSNNIELGINIKKITVDNTKRLNSYLTISNIIELIDEVLAYFAEQSKDAGFKSRYDTIVDIISQKKGLSTDEKVYKGAVNFYEAIKRQNYGAIFNEEHGVVCYSNDINHVLPMVTTLKTADGLPEEQVIKVTPEGLLISLLSKYYTHINIIKMMLEVFNSDSIMKEHNNLWLFYEKLRK